MVQVYLDSFKTVNGNSVHITIVICGTVLSSLSFQNTFIAVHTIYNLLNDDFPNESTGIKKVKEH